MSADHPSKPPQAPHDPEAESGAPPPDGHAPDAAALLREQEVVLVSACLLGAACRYDGRSKALPALRALLADKAVVPICPEAAAGLGTPRPATQLQGGDGRAVWDGAASARTVEGGEDRTDAFMEGAACAAAAAKAFGVKLAVLKQRSPSCGSRQVWVDGQLVEGEGITTTMLRSRGITVLGEEELPTTG